MWIAEQFSECIAAFAEKVFKVRGIVTDNHSGNVAAFNILMKKFSGEGVFVQHPSNSTKTYLFFDKVHLLKKISEITC